MLNLRKEFLFLLWKCRPVTSSRPPLAPRFWHPNQLSLSWQIWPIIHWESYHSQQSNLNRPLHLPPFQTFSNDSWGVKIYWFTIREPPFRRGTTSKLLRKFSALFISRDLAPGTAVTLNLWLRVEFFEHSIATRYAFTWNVLSDNLFNKASVQFACRSCFSRIYKSRPLIRRRQQVSRSV